MKREVESAEVLCLEDVSARLGGRRILERIGLVVSPGEVVGLVGRNGAGKTTLLRLAGGSLAPSEGRVRVKGEELASIS
ncbi:MAG: ATP-binding cassette domain-containing protein, partial [Deltaproteobacteria bacterium]|nr:ATP-binding cassette domain-containing protein [Deltaproteobacteria bacterium]